jgi:TonB family protein
MRVCVVALAMMVGCATESTSERRPSSAGTAEAPERATEPDPAAVSPERQEAIERLFARKAGDLQGCWTEEYERNHNRKLEGDVVVHLVVDPAGQAGDVKVLKSSLNNQEIETCVVKAVSGWSFPEGKASMPVTRTVHLGAQF